MSGLSKTQVRALLRVVQSPETLFKASQVLREISEDYHLGYPKGASLVFEIEDKRQLRALLQAEGIDPQTDPSAWDGLSRAAALRLGPNEKLARTPVKRGRVAIKTLVGQPLRLAGDRLRLPPGCHLDVEAATVATLLDHRTVLLVENWECFERIHDVDLDLAPAGENPLVVWRGDASRTRPDHALALLEALDGPVWAFVDYDPAGLLIAVRLPRLAGLIAPSPERLEADLARGLAERYRDQLPQSGAVLDASEYESIRRLWALIQRHGRALPQEYYLRETVSCDRGSN
ncbi:DUF7281 domain-containing protein [Allochromatium vinosum]|uniref:DUF7281 domain-containing protein n=1 Tax=Allochromatium vinosum TaxID=1049 RepID=UPI00190317B2|nr:hypothetical protein [Allochromatium vinosum]